MERSRVYRMDTEYSHTLIEIPFGQTILIINPLTNEGADPAAPREDDIVCKK